MHSKIIRISIFVLMLATVSSCTLGRYIWYNSAEVDDHKYFDQSTIRNDELNTFQFNRSTKAWPIDSLSITKKGKSNRVNFNQYLEDNHTLAFVIIQNDTILYENYFNKHSSEAISGSFSMAKSIVSLLVGCAIKDGYINSEKDAITKYLPELSKNGFDNITVEHLLQMTSGIKFWENYWVPFADAGNFYYGRDLWRLTKRLKKKYEPGTHHDYRSVDTQLLGFVLNRALKDMTLSEYLEMKLWKPMGMENNASWLIDSKGMERAFVGINATALDYAKIGRLVLNDGNWDGKQLIEKEWIEKSFAKDTSDASPIDYQYQWYLKDGGDKGSYAFGYRGQIIYFNKDSNLIGVRLGKKQGELNWSGLFYSISEKYK